MHSSFVKLLCGNVTELFNGILCSLPIPVGVREMQMATNSNLYTLCSETSFKIKVIFICGLMYANIFFCSTAAAINPAC